MTEEKREQWVVQADKNEPPRDVCVFAGSWQIAGGRVMGLPYHGNKGKRHQRGSSGHLTWAGRMGVLALTQNDRPFSACWGRSALLF